MSYSIKDLENAGRKLNQHFEQKSQKKSEELAERVLYNTSQGRGLWVIILWPAWLLIFIFASYFFKNLLEITLSLSMPISLVGLVGGFTFAMLWYKWEYTLKHPVIASIIGYLGTALVSMLLLGVVN